MVTTPRRKSTLALLSTLPLLFAVACGGDDFGDDRPDAGGGTPGGPGDPPATSGDTMSTAVYDRLDASKELAVATAASGRGVTESSLPPAACAGVGGISKVSSGSTAGQLARLPG